MKSIEFRQNLVILLLGVVGFALAKSWPDRKSRPEKEALKRYLVPIISGAVSLVMMLLEQRRLVQTLSEQSITEFLLHWLNFGEPALDILIVLMAGWLLVGLLI